MVKAQSDSAEYEDADDGVVEEEGPSDSSTEEVLQMQKVRHSTTYSKYE